MGGALEHRASLSNVSLVLFSSYGVLCSSNARTLYANALRARESSLFYRREVPGIIYLVYCIYLEAGIDFTSTIAWKKIIFIRARLRSTHEPRGRRPTQTVGSPVRSGSDRKPHSKAHRPSPRAAAPDFRTARAGGIRRAVGSIQPHLGLCLRQSSPIW